MYKIKYISARGQKIHGSTINIPTFVKLDTILKSDLCQKHNICLTYCIEDIIYLIFK